MVATQGLTVSIITSNCQLLQFASEKDFERDTPCSLPSRNVSEEFLGQDETKVLCRTGHEQCIVTLKTELQLYLHSFSNP